MQILVELAFTSRKLSMGSTSDFTALICRWVPSLIPAAASLLTSCSVERQLRMRKLMHWGNINAFRACHFLRWVLEDGDMVSRLWYLGLAPRHHTLSKKKKSTYTVQIRYCIISKVVCWNIAPYRQTWYALCHASLYPITAMYLTQAYLRLWHITLYVIPIYTPPVTVHALFHHTHRHWFRYLHCLTGSCHHYLTIAYLRSNSFLYGI